MDDGAGSGLSRSWQDGARSESDLGAPHSGTYTVSKGPWVNTIWHGGSVLSCRGQRVALSFFSLQYSEHRRGGMGSPFFRCDPVYMTNHLRGDLLNSGAPSTYALDVKPSSGAAAAGTLSASYIPQ